MTDVLMPQMGESITEGTVTRWLKHVGDRVQRDEPLLEISTDKVDAEVPAPATGVLTEVLAAEGATVAVATILARIAAADEAGAGLEVVASVQEPAAPAPVPAVPEEPPALPAPVAPAVEPSDTPQPLPEPTSSPEELRRTRSSPLVRRIAAEHEVDISGLRGTGLDGRVTRQDLQSYIAQRSPAASAPASAAPAPNDAAAQPGPAADGQRVVALSPSQRRTAEQMVASQRISAHATTVFEIDMTRVERLREAQARIYQQRGAPLTHLAFVVKATLDALRATPLLNASLDEGRIVYHTRVHLGVSLPLESGLVVPVIRNADGQSVFDLARALADLSERARTRRLRPEEMQHGTFTVSSAGALGSLIFVPIIYQPQVAILTVGAVERRPVAVGDAIAIRSRAFFALSFDQRLIDAAEADRFMGRLRSGIEEFNESAV